MEEQADAPLAPLTTLGLGGPARRLVTADVEDDVVAAVRAADAVGEPVLVLGGGSNVVIADEGFPGTVVGVATRGVRVARDSGDTVVLEVSAGEPWEALVARCVADGLAGVEALSGIPGSTGATPVQNVGAYGQEVADTVQSVRVLDRSTGGVGVLPAASCGFGYRTSVLKNRDRYVVLAVTLRLRADAGGGRARYGELARRLGVQPGDRVPLADVRAAVLELRGSKGMVLDKDDPDTRSVGSFFTNPVLSSSRYDELVARVTRTVGSPVTVPHFDDGPDRVKVPAAWLVERAGFRRGHGPGPVRLSTKHTLALTHPGGASTEQLLDLAREVRDGVRTMFDLDLSPEPVLVGCAV